MAPHTGNVTVHLNQTLVYNLIQTLGQREVSNGATVNVAIIKGLIMGLCLGVNKPEFSAVLRYELCNMIGQLTGLNPEIIERESYADSDTVVQCLT